MREPASIDSSQLVAAVAADAWRGHAALAGRPGVASVLAGPIGGWGAAAAVASGCRGGALAVTSASPVPGQSATLAVTAQNVTSPGLAGFQLSAAYDPTLATVIAVQGGPSLPQLAANLQTAAQGRVSIAGASAQGATGGGA